MNLYEIDEKLKNAIEYGCDVETGEFIEEEQLNNLYMELDKKIEGTALYQKNLSAEIDALDKEIQALTERKEKKEKLKKSIEKYLSDYLINNEIFKFETPKVLIKFRKSTKVNVTDQSKVPAEFIKTVTKVEEKVDKKAVSNFLNTHTDTTIEGIELVTNQNIKIV